MIFNAIISSAWQGLCQFSPFAIQDMMTQKQNPLLLRRPVLLFDIGIEMITPSLPALLSYSMRH